MTGGWVPRSVDQAQHDRTLSPTTRTAMYLLMDLLTVDEWREVKMAALASLIGCKEQTAGRALHTLVRKGYLQQRNGDGRRRLYRVPWSQRTTHAIAA